MALNQPQLNIDHHDPSRYGVSRPEQALPWVIEEIYYYVPEQYHEMLELYMPLKTSFLKGYGNMHYITANNMRLVAPFVFKLRANWMVCDPPQVDQAMKPVIFCYLRWDTTKLKALYPVFPPVLYPNCFKNSALMFRNVQLCLLLSCILFRRESVLSSNISNTQDNQSIKVSRDDLDGEIEEVVIQRQVSGPLMNAVLWGLTQVTPGMTAFGAVIAMFFLSADTELTMYKKVLVTTVVTPSIMETMRCRAKMLLTLSSGSSAPEDNISNTESSAVGTNKCYTQALHSATQDSSHVPAPVASSHQSGRTCPEQPAAALPPVPTARLLRPACPVTNHAVTAAPAPATHPAPIPHLDDLNDTDFEGQDKYILDNAYGDDDHGNADNHYDNNTDNYDIDDATNYVVEHANDCVYNEPVNFEGEERHDQNYDTANKVSHKYIDDMSDTDDNTGPRMTYPVQMVQPPDVSMIVEEDEVANDNYEKREYTESDDSEDHLGVPSDTDGELGVPSDSSDEEIVPICSVCPHSSLRLSVVQTAQASAATVCNNSHYPNIPLTIQSLQSMPLPGPGGARRPASRPARVHIACPNSCLYDINHNIDANM
ncbi:hypothetical protein NUW54_g48 [Trametes sanguinea]|uniref:Uncharacterized protein n=2 Tax=Trametes sanguinea TaxID=158606 RepID=A0ACC1QDG4_9APHY|nr:hypothetical protein NUW54_g654 [Trametes sanguinea]KAJ3019582.1 hypothetical protein NUW54_g48 [Trametes sanguinea]